MAPQGTAHNQAVREKVEAFDTTLRDGMQVEGVSATVEDKLRIAEQLDYLGVDYIEGGWPGANPKDVEFFARAVRELNLRTSTLVAFGSTRRPKGKVDDDATLRQAFPELPADLQPAGGHRVPPWRSRSLPDSDPRTRFGSSS